MTKKHYVFYNSIERPEIRKDTIIAGIDQSYSHTAITIGRKDKILAVKTIQTTPTKPIELRAIDIRDFILTALKEYRVQHVIIEGLAFSSNQASAKQLAGLLFIIISNLYDNHYQYSIIPPSELKKHATNKGNADKVEMIEAIPKETIQTLENLSNKKSTQKLFYDISDSYHLYSFFL